MYKNILLSIIISISFMGCITKTPYPINESLPKIQLEKTQNYILDNSNLNDKFIQTATEFQDELEYKEIEGKLFIIMSQETYSKIADMIQMTKSYKDVTTSQESLINTYISEINSLKELAELEREQTIAYQKLWISIQNIYENERKLHKKDNIINKLFLYSSNILWIVSSSL